MHVVWFKRDLRLEDHEPLLAALAAADSGGLTCLYCYEPNLLESPEWDRSHSQFIDECLTELAAEMAKRGGQLTFRRGEITAVLQELNRNKRISALYSHEESGNAITYQRDLAVAAWCKEHNIPWREYQQTGVVRRLGNRDGWSKRWNITMKREPYAAPESIRTVPINHGTRLDPQDLVGKPSTVHSEFHGGNSQAWKHLESFLTQRGMPYQQAMSSPVTAWQACSRISPYLTFGALSIRQAYHAVEEARQSIKGQRSDEAKAWRGSYASFAKRLRWHCHFMQKIEDEPDIEFRNMHRGFDGLREHEFNDEYYQAWIRGETGYPLVDACMRSVATTGWLTFRMRAMVVSFASYHLWLHWRKPATWLAQHFLDFEPGIHYSQIQMQSGVTGINTLRIYSPTKQLTDHDPNGEFVRKWVPELSHIPNEHLAEPCAMPQLLQDMYGVRIGSDYPLPLVNHKEATTKARERIYTRRKDPMIRAQSQAVYTKHGSRRRPEQRR
jgi:deoxyribodipyrimidine photo-lyase